MLKNIFCEVDWKKLYIKILCITKFWWKNIPWVIVWKKLYTKLLCISYKFPNKKVEDEKYYLKGKNAALSEIARSRGSWRARWLDGPGWVRSVSGRDIIFHPVRQSAWKAGGGKGPGAISAAGRGRTARTGTMMESTRTDPGAIILDSALQTPRPWPPSKKKKTHPWPAGAAHQLFNHNASFLATATGCWAIVAVDWEIKRFYYSQFNSWSSMVNLPVR